MVLAAAVAGRPNRWLVALTIVFAFAVLPGGPRLGAVAASQSGPAAIAIAIAALVPLTFRRVPARTSMSDVHRLATREVSVVVPTRHERDAVQPLLDRLDSALAGYDAEVVFVDDSDDDTPEVILAADGRGLAVTLRHREPDERAGGLGSAVIAGLTAAQGRLAVVMDADLQHPPEIVPALIGEAHRSGADLVVGSRKALGGSSGDGLSVTRRNLSWAAAAAARFLYPVRLRRTSDPMSGLFLVRPERLDLRRMDPEGFKILLEILVTHPQLRIAEVGFRFDRRLAGQSKATVREAMRYLGHLFDLRVRSVAPWVLVRDVGSRPSRVEPVATPERVTPGVASAR